MKKRRFLQGLFVCFLLLGLGLMPAKTAKAAVQKAPGYLVLKPGVMYRSCDVTGDRRADSFAVQRVYNNTAKKYTGVIVKINGQAAYQFRNSYYDNMSIYLITLKNGKPFIYMYAQGDNGDGPVCALFQYRSGRLVKVIDFQTFAGKYGIHESGRVIKISGDTVTARFSVMSWSLGIMEMDYVYAYKGGTLKRTSTTGIIRKSWQAGTKNRNLIANRSFAVYKTPGKTARAFVLKKGYKAAFTGKCWINHGKLYFQVSRNGVNGWVKAAAAAPSSSKWQQFSNVTYAG